VDLAIPIHAACMDTHQFEGIPTNLLSVFVCQHAHICTRYLYFSDVCCACIAIKVMGSGRRLLCTSMLWAYSVNLRLSIVFLALSLAASLVQHSHLFQAGLCFLRLFVTCAAAVQRPCIPSCNPLKLTHLRVLQVQISQPYRLGQIPTALL